MNLRKSLILCTLVLCALCGCKKKAPESQPAPAESAAPAAAAPKADAAKVDAAAPTDAAKADAAAAAPAPTDAVKADAAPAPTDVAPADAPIPDAAPAMICPKWGNIPFFTDGKALHFKYHEIKVYFSPENIKPTWKCDEDEICTQDLTATLECTVKLVLAESDYCASEVQCAVKGDNPGEIDVADSYTHGLWAIDSNGVYHPSNYDIGESTLKRRTSPVDCADLQFTECKPGTLVHDYEGFARYDALMPTIPFIKTNVHESECEEELVCTELEIKHEGAQWTVSSSVVGGENTEETLTWDAQRGLVKYGNKYSGGMKTQVELTAM